jgi:uncharacterized alkaline shock family protein YloU
MTEEDVTQRQPQDSPLQQDSPLRSERGGTRIEDSVVAKIAGIAAQEVDGVRMGRGSTQAIGGILSSVTGGSVGSGSESRGVTVEVGEVEAAIDLTLTVEYGKSIPQISEAVRRNAINRVENLVGLNVTEVNIAVSDVFFPEQERQQEQERRRSELEQQQRAGQQQQAGEEQRVR